MSAQQNIDKTKEPRRKRAVVGTDFRVTFAQMADDSVIDRNELAVVLATTPGAVSMLAFRGKLPQKAFPESKRACWFVRDIRRWLKQVMSEQPARKSESVEVSQLKNSDRPRIGRPRKDAATF